MEPGRFRAFADFNWSPGPGPIGEAEWLGGAWQDRGHEPQIVNFSLAPPKTDRGIPHSAGTL